jgi:hypothetical protein
MESTTKEAQMSTRPAKTRLANVMVTGGLILVMAASMPAPAQVCGPDPDGRVANAVYRDTMIVWEPVVEYDQMVLTIGGPCEDIVRVFRRGEPIFFDIRDIKRVQDGAYTWELRRVPVIDPATQKALAKARALGDDSIWWDLWQSGAIPQGPYTDSASFLVANGVIVPPGLEEGKSGLAAKTAAGTAATRPQVSSARVSSPLPAASAKGSNLTPVTAADQVIPDDLIVQGSLCVGFDCVNGESFSFDTIRLKENNLRIKFDDTSTLSGFPSNDWQLTANDSASGGASKFSIEDVTGAKVPFTVRAGAPSNSIFVSNAGRVGFRTATPVLDLHVNTSNTPGLRLEQNSSGGFAAQTWDIAGNETNFFIRDVTGGSRLPFRIRPGAPTSSIDINADGEVGIGTASPTEELTVKSDGGNSDVLVVLGSAVTNPTLYRIFETTGGDGLFSLFDNSGAEAVRFSSAAGGRLGIGCNSPEHDVDLGGTVGAACAGQASRSFIDAGSTTFTASSSRTLKENVAPVRVSNILDKIASIGVYNYDFVNGPKDKIGLMAEDFHTIFERGSEKLLNGQEVEMALWLAVQQLTVQNRELTTQNKELSRRLADLEARVNPAQTGNTP